MADYGGGAATGAFCYNEDALPPEYWGNLFLADFGKRQLLRLRIEREGATYKVALREDLFADPEFFRKHAAKVNQLTTELDAAKENVTKLYARWEELEGIRAASGVPLAD